MTDAMKLLLKRSPELQTGEAHTKPKLLSTCSIHQQINETKWCGLQIRTTPAPLITCIAKLLDPVTADAMIELDGDEPSIRTVPETVKVEVTRKLPEKT